MAVKQRANCRGTGRPFSKGDRRINRKGRPRKAESVTHWLREIGAAHDGQRFKRLADALWRLALDGDLPAIRELLDRLEGRPKQAIGLEPDINIDIPGIRAVLPPGMEAKDL